MDFVKLYPIASTFNASTLGFFVKDICKMIKKLALDQDVIAQRLLEESFQYFGAIPSDWQSDKLSNYTARETSEGFIHTREIYHALLSLQSIQKCLLKRKGGKELIDQMKALKKERSTCIDSEECIRFTLKYLEPSPGYIEWSK